MLYDQEFDIGGCERLTEETRKLFHEEFDDSYAAELIGYAEIFAKQR